MPNLPDSLSLVARMPHTSSRLFRLLAALVLAGSFAHEAGRAQVPSVLVPGPADSAVVESPAAPLIVPGASPLDSTARTPQQRAQAEYHKGRALERQGFPGAAIMAYTNATRADPDLRDAHFRIGLLFLTRQQWVPAALSFAEELKLDPANRDAGREFGWALANAGDSARSIRQLELLVRRDARDQAAWQTLGFAYSRFGRAVDAERALRRAVALDARDADAWRDLGVVLSGAGKLAEARAAYRRALTLAPDDESALVNLGNLEGRAGRWDDALSAYQRAERTDSTQWLAYRGQVDALRALDREEEGGAVLRRWLRITPEDSPTRIEAISLFERAGRHDIAVELGRDAVRHDPRSGEAWLALAMAHRAGGELRDALTEFREAERRLKAADQRERVRVFIGAMRGTAPDSLRSVFEADSIAHEAPAPPALEPRTP